MPKNNYLSFLEDPSVIQLLQECFRGYDVGCIEYAGVPLKDAIESLSHRIQPPRADSPKAAIKGQKGGSLADQFNARNQAVDKGQD